MKVRNRMTGEGDSQGNEFEAAKDRQQETQDLMNKATFDMVSNIHRIVVEEKKKVIRFKNFDPKRFFGYGTMAIVLTFIFCSLVIHHYGSLFSSGDSIVELRDDILKIRRRFG